MAVDPLTLPWGFWPVNTGLAKTVQNYPWLDGGAYNVAVVDKGIDYWHPALGGNRATGVKSPRVVNVFDYQDNDTDPFPNTSEAVDGTSPHGTGVAGLLAGIPYASPDNQRYQGVLQNSKLYNIRTNRFDSQNTIKKALAWIAAALRGSAREHGFESDAWTNGRLRSVIESRYGVRYSRVYVWQIATNLGLGHLLSKSRR